MAVEHEAWEVFKAARADALADANRQRPLELVDDVEREQAYEEAAREAVETVVTRFGRPRAGSSLTGSERERDDAREALRDLLDELPRDWSGMSPMAHRRVQRAREIVKGLERTHIPVSRDQGLALDLVARLIDRAPDVVDREAERTRKTMLESAALIERLLGIRDGNDERTHALTPITACQDAAGDLYARAEALRQSGQEHAARRAEALANAFESAARGKPFGS